MTYLIDTDWLVDYLYGNPQARQLLSDLEPDGIAISIVTYLEIYEGIQLSRDPKQAEQAIRSVLRRLQVLPLSRTVAKETARVRAVLRRNKAPLAHRALDLIIAGTALAYDLELVTRNTRDYTDVPNLRRYQI
ncbi:MAG: PIN domain-containing protein [Chloroflexi bacterium]|nr:PIN domain-containing protein [Chloroflexota bacterium]